MVHEVQGYDLFLDAWLGDALQDMNEAQRAEFGRLVRAYTATQTGREGEDAKYHEEDNAAWVAAYQQAMGLLDVAARGRAYRHAQTAANIGAMISALAGTSEVQASRDATITRTKLRQLLGKTPR